MSKQIWIKKEVFSWSSTVGSRSSTNRKDHIRAYELWEHAEKLLKFEKTELHIVDAISTLKRCLNQRLMFIEEVYKFKEISLKDSPKGYLEYLETFSLVRPLMPKKLMIIRNDIEHYDTKPPELERCLELLDLTWYFLKSTDNFLVFINDSIVYELLNENNEETQYSFTLDIDFKTNHKLEIHGWFPNNLISEVEIDNSIKLDVKSIHTKIEKWIDTSHHEDKLNDDIWVVGELDASLELKHKIIKNSLK